MVYYLTKVTISCNFGQIAIEDIILFRQFAPASGQIQVLVYRFPKIMNLTLMLANHSAGGRTPICKAFVERSAKAHHDKVIERLLTNFNKTSSEDPDVLELENDYPTINKAKVLRSITMNADMKQLKTGLDSMIKAIDGANSRGDYSFQDSLATFREKAEVQVELLASQFKSCFDQYGEACKYMAEDPKKVNSEDFYKLLASFINLFKVTREKAEKLRARRAAEAKRDAASAGKKQKPRVCRGETVDDRSNSEAIQDGLKGRRKRLSMSEKRQRGRENCSRRKLRCRYLRYRLGLDQFLYFLRKRVSFFIQLK